MANSKNENLNTPRGVLIYPHLVEPDYGNDEYPKPQGEYNTMVKLSAHEAQPLIAKLEPLHQEAVAIAESKFKNLKPAQKKKLGKVQVNDFFIEEYDKETEEPTGNLLFKFKSKASGTKNGKEWTRTIPLFDAGGKRITPDSVWGGSEGKVAFTVVPYFIPATGAAGISCYLNAVQILELRNGGGGTADSFGFGEEEGYHASEESTDASDAEEEEEDPPFDLEEDTDF